MTVDERMSTISEDKQRLLKVMRKIGFDLSFEKRGKKNYWVFSYDQGVYLGQNVYYLRQDELSPRNAIPILFDEGFNFGGDLNTAISNAFWSVVEKPNDR